ncbi:MAG: LysR family transcriptional regulator [Gammaproteobacteria bacterium]|nr:LysR family transcriptional regulator [Gammaproteobacteria bacterium]
MLKAAEKLNITQPAVTRTIRDLENIFAIELFERNNRGVTPTIFGAALSNRTKQILAELRSAVDEINSIKNAEEGHVIVGTLI